MKTKLVIASIIAMLGTGCGEPFAIDVLFPDSWIGSDTNTFRALVLTKAEGETDSTPIGCDQVFAVQGGSPDGSRGRFTASFDASNVSDLNAEREFTVVIFCDPLMVAKGICRSEDRPDGTDTLDGLVLAQKSTNGSFSDTKLTLTFVDDDAFATSCGSTDGPLECKVVQGECTPTSFQQSVEQVAIGEAVPEE